MPAAQGWMIEGAMAPPRGMGYNARKSMNEQLQKLVRQLGEAINDTINESEAVNEALARIRATGNEVFLVLEATIAFKEMPAANASNESDQPPLQTRLNVDERLSELSAEDQRFLRSLNIRLDAPDE
jgi:hypothetical protein